MNSIKNKFVGLAISLLLILVTFTPAIIGTKVNNNLVKNPENIFIDKTNRIIIKLHNITYIDFEESATNGYSKYLVNYSIKNIGTIVYSDETVLTLDFKGTDWGFDYWIEKITLNPGESISLTHVTKIPSSEDSSLDEERYFAGHDLKIQVYNSIEEGSIDYGFGNYYKKTEDYKPTFSHLIVSTPWNYNETYINEDIFYIKLNNFYEFPDVLKNQRLGWIFELEEYLVSITEDLKLILNSDNVQFVNKAWVYVKPIMTWIKDLCYFFDSLVHSTISDYTINKLFTLLEYSHIILQNHMESLIDTSEIYYGETIKPITDLKDEFNEFYKWQSKEPWCKEIKVAGQIQNVKKSERIKITCRDEEFIFYDEDDGKIDNILNFSFNVPINQSAYNEKLVSPHDCMLFIEGDKHNTTIQTVKTLSYCFSNGTIKVKITENDWNKSKTKSLLDVIKNRLFTKFFSWIENGIFSNLIKRIKDFRNKNHQKENNVEKSIIEQRKERAQEIAKTFDFNDFQSYVKKHGKKIKGKNYIILKEYYPDAPTDDPFTTYYQGDEVIVGFDDSVDVSKLNYVEGYKVKDFIKELHAVLLEVNDIDPKVFIKNVKKRDDVCYAELNIMFELCTDDPLWGDQWGHRKLNIDKAWEHELKMKYSFIAILDTGLDYKHLDLWGSDAAPYYLNQYDVFNDDPIAEDESGTGHGTAMTGIIAAQINNNKGIAGILPDDESYSHNPRVTPNIGHFKIFGKNVDLTPAWKVADGIKFSIFNFMPSVISMSLESKYSSDLVRNATFLANYLYGTLICGATGNKGFDGINEGGQKDIGVCYPAKYNSVIAVGAIDQNEELCRYFGDWGSNYNAMEKEVDLVGPGVNIVTTDINGGCEYWGKTSAATAYIAGLIGLWYGGRAATKIDPSFDNEPTRCKADLFNPVNCKDLGEPGRDPMYGYGLPDADKIVPGEKSKDYSLNKI